MNYINREISFYRPIDFGAVRVQLKLDTLPFCSAIICTHHQGVQEGLNYVRFYLVDDAMMQMGDSGVSQRVAQLRYLSRSVIASTRLYNNSTQDKLGATEPDGATRHLASRTKVEEK